MCLRLHFEVCKMEKQDLVSEPNVTLENVFVCEVCGKQYHSSVYVGMSAVYVVYSSALLAVYVELSL